MSLPNPQQILSTVESILLAPLQWLGIISITGTGVATITPQSGGVGTQFEMVGSGFAPNAILTYVITGPNGVVTQSGSQQCSPSGTFGPIIIPYNTNGGVGTYTIAFYGGAAPNVTYTET